MTMQLINLKTGEPDSDVKGGFVQALASGTHTPADGARALVSPDGGDLHIIPQDQLHDAINAGYKLPNQHQLDEFADAEKYSGGVNTAKALGLGALRGASFGLSDVVGAAADKLPGSNPADSYKELATGLLKHHPTASTVGELGGAVGSALLAPETSPAGLVSKLGKAVTAAALPKEAGVVGKVAAHVLGGAAEGSMYGHAQTVTEAALGDPNVAAEHLLSNMGMGAFFGGGLGGIVEAGSMAIPKSVQVAKDTTAAAWKKLFGDANGGEEAAEPFFKRAGTPGEPDVTPPGPTPEESTPGAVPSAIAKAKEAFTGTPVEETLASFKERGATGKVLDEAERTKFQSEIEDSMQNVHDAMEKASKDVSHLARPKESADLAQGVDTQTALDELGKVKGHFENTIANMRSQPDIYPARFPAKLETILDGLESGISEKSNAADIYQEITRTRKALDDKIPWNKEITGEAADAISDLKELRGKLRTSLENQDVWGAAGARTEAFNNTAKEYLNSLKIFRKEFMEKIPTSSGGVKYNVSPTKVGTFLNSINDSRGAKKANALRGMFQSSLDHLDEMEKSHAAAPFEGFNKEALQSLLDKNIAQATQAQNVVAAQPGMGYGGMHNLFKLGIASHFGGPLGVAASLAKDAIFKPDALAAKLANIENIVSKGSAKISKAMGPVFEASGKVARASVGPLAKQMIPDDRSWAIHDKIEKLRARTSSPPVLVDELHKATKAGFGVAPKTMSAMQATAIRGLQFLESKAPPTAADNPFDTPPEASQASLMAFDRYHQVVHDPLSILDELKEGTLAPESVEALKSVYPNLHSEIAQAAIAKASTMKGRVPYRTRLMLSQFIGEPIDKSMTPAAIQMSQTAMSMPQSQGQGHGGPRPSAKGLEHLDVAGRSATSFQQTSLRGEG